MSRVRCESIRPLISAFMDGELNEDETSELLQHLASCASCRAVLDEYRALRDDLRALPPAPPPPPDLRRRIWRETVEQSPHRHRLHRLAASLPLPAAAALAILLVISAFALSRGYERGVAPAVAGSSPTTGAEWPVYRPITIAFTKPMDHDSVVEHLRVLPSDPARPLPTSWNGNTLVIGRSATETVSLLPDTDYTVMITAGARDTWGNALAQPWILTFHTSRSVAQRPLPTVTPIQPTPLSTAVPPVAAASPAVTPVPATRQTAPTRGPSGSTTSPTTPSTSQPIVGSPGPAETELPSPPAPTATPAASPATAPTATQTPPPTPTAPPPPTDTPPPSTPTPTPVPAEPTPTPTPIIAVSGAFGSVYWANQDVQARLGAPTALEVVVEAQELAFQRGLMYERLDTSTIYVLRGDNAWAQVPDTWSAADGDGGGPGPEPSLWVPGKGFGKVWSADGGLQQAIGYATAPSARAISGGGHVQTFEHGLMLYSDQGFVYVLYDDGAWALYPDSSGHTDALTPTPVSAPPTPTATPAPGGGASGATPAASSETSATNDAGPSPTRSPSVAATSATAP